MEDRVTGGEAVAEAQAFMEDRVTGGQAVAEAQAFMEDRVTGGHAIAEAQAFMEDRAGLKGWQEFAGIRVFCWRMQRAVHLLLCVRLVELCVHVLVCN